MTGSGKAMSMRINQDLCILYVTYKCDCSCDNCGSNCNKKQAPSDEMLKLERLEYFIKDTIDCDKKYKNVALFGGEPTLHPQFEEMCLMLKEANDKNHFASSLTVCTNGYTHESLQKCHFAAEHGYVIENSHKDRQIHDKTFKYTYVPINVAPIDVGFIPELNGCWYSENAGIAFDNKGYWGCNPLCAAARVFDYEPICASIKDFTEEKVKESFAKHCKYCGSAFPIAPVFIGTRLKADPDAIDVVTKQPTERVLNQSMSKTWVEAFKRYHDKIMIKTEEEQRIEDGY